MKSYILLAFLESFSSPPLQPPLRLILAFLLTADHPLHTDGRGAKEGIQKLCAKELPKLKRGQFMVTTATFIHFTDSMGFGLFSAI